MTAVQTAAGLSFAWIYETTLGVRLAGDWLLRRRLPSSDDLRREIMRVFNRFEIAAAESTHESVAALSRTVAALSREIADVLRDLARS